MNKATDITNQKFGALTALFMSGSKNGRAVWKCLCDCGNEKDVFGRDLRAKNVTSCGCYNNRSKLKTTHNMSKSKTYAIWSNMKLRCNNKNDNSYYLYGGRGIKVCDRWELFENFLEDMGEKPEGHSIERLDVNKDYSPENCIWATSKKQSRNTRRNKFITYNNQTKILKDWANELNIYHGTLRNRLESGWDVEKAFNQPTKNSILKGDLYVQS